MKPSFLRLCQKLSLDSGKWICSSQASIERFKKSSCKADAAELLSAPDVLNHVLAEAGDARPGVGGKLLQIGGDANTERGWWWCKLSNPKTRSPDLASLPI